MPEPTPAIRQAILAAAERYDLDPALTFAVVEAESAFDPNAKGDWTAGQLVGSYPMSYGLMQLHLRGAGAAYVDDPTALLDPELNLEIGTAYLRAMQDATGSLIGTLAAYNGGLGNWQRGVVVWSHMEAYIQAYLRWQKRLLQEQTLLYLDAAWGRSRSQWVRDHLILAKQKGLGLP